MAELDCDVLVIGSGAAGATVAATLAERAPDLRIVMVERGGHFTRAFFNQREWEMSSVLYAEGGTRSTVDGAIPVRGGECVGGGTTVNLSLCFDPVESVWARWGRERGLAGFSFDAGAADYGVAGLGMGRARDEVRARLGVHEATDAEVNPNNAFFEGACRARGVTSKRFGLNMRGCIGCGFCSSGCAYDAKQSTLITYVEDAIARGVRLVHHCDIEGIEWGERGGRRVTTGAIGRVRESHAGSRANTLPPGEVRFGAKLVVLACGAIESPALLQRSGLPDPHDVLGRGLVIHPSLPIVGLTDREIAGHRGVEGSVYSDHFVASHGFYLECLFGHPLYGAAILPGFGAAHFETMLAYRKLAGFGVMLLDRSSRENRVLWDSSARRAQIHYALTEDDAERLRFAAARSVEIMFAGGAREVILPSEEPVGELASPRFTRGEQASLCAELRFLPHQTVITSAHAQATLKMAADPREGALDARGECFEASNVVVCDGAAFPETCGANPMISIMTLARYQATRIAGERARYGL